LYENGKIQQLEAEIVVLDRNLQGTRKRGRPRKAWRRSVTEEAQRGGRTRMEVKKSTADRGRWKNFVEVICSYTGDNRK
jgi:predicted ArsR family transcriptional regulator